MQRRIVGPVIIQNATLAAEVQGLDKESVWYVNAGMWPQVQWGAVLVLWPQLNTITYLTLHTSPPPASFNEYHYELCCVDSVSVPKQ